MRARTGKLFPPNLVPTFFLAAMAALVLVAIAALSCRHLPQATWLVIGLSVLFVAISHVRMARTWSSRVKRVVEAVRLIAEGSSKWRKSGPEARLIDTLGEEAGKAFTELSETVESLREDKRRAELVLANMADGMIAISRDGKISMFNRAAGALLDIKPSSVLGKQVGDVDLHPEIVRIADECASTQEEVVSEIQLPGHPQRTIGLRATPFPVTGSTSDQAIIILHDLTEIRHHERVQREFVSNVGHELRTPLTAVRTTAEALLSGAKHDEAMLDRFLNTIISETDRLSTLVDDLTEIIKISSGITKTEKTECQMSDIIFQAVEVVRPQAEKKNISLSVEVEQGLTGFCDSTQMVQVVRNLVDNAVKYTQEGGEVKVWAGKDESGLVIRVVDNGIGIPKGEIPRIFERFYRVDKTRSRRLGGTGLGLAIVKEIVESHGGSVSVESELGKGSTFTVLLPFADGARSD